MKTSSSRRRAVQPTSRTARCLLAVLAALAGGAFPADAQVLRLAEMDAATIAGLDRDRTVIILTGGILEQHGPFLPSFSDGYWSERLARAVADAIIARPGWTVVMAPTIPLGNSGANDVGGRFSFPGSYTVRMATLRSVFMDLAAELGDQGFRRIFVVHAHGAPNHSRALDQAGDYFRDTYGGFMVHLAGLLPVMEAWDGPKSEAQRAEDGLPIHSGMDETSWMLFLRPDLVRAGYREAVPLAGADMEAVIRIAERPDWPGYFGSPRLASVAHGAAIWSRASATAIGLALAILDGADPRGIPRFADEMLASPEDARLDRASLDREAAEQRRQEAWLRRNGLGEPGRQR